MNGQVAEKPLETPVGWALQGFSTVLAMRCDPKGGWIVAAGEAQTVSLLHPGGGFDALRGLVGGGGQWVFAALDYALAAEAEPALQPRPGTAGWPVLHAFVPQAVVRWQAGAAKVLLDNDGSAQRLALALAGPPGQSNGSSPVWESPDPALYRIRAAELMRHIQRGDIYEVNYCVQRRAAAPDFDPYKAFAAMDLRAKAPHAAFYKHQGRYALCQSPERFLRIAGDRLSGQPMKGTRPRHADPVRDSALARELAQDPKERSENIMAVDVLRHDLSRVAASGSVVVDELCAVKQFPAVHQMTSTVSARLRNGLHPVDALRSCFPPASMTGAPKQRAMELIAAAEAAPRGLYSGALGYFTPDGDADFNVVIRTLLFDRATGSLSLTTGSALTAACDPEQEWEECELKARSVLNTLG